MSEERILLVGALGVEVAPLLRRLEGARVSGRLVVGSLAGREVGVLTVGVGPVKAQARTTAALARFPADRVISLGTCGALEDRYEIGTLLTASSLRWEDGAAWTLEPLPHLLAVGGVTVTRAVWTKADRERLAAMGAAFCEMEAAGVHAAAPGRTQVLKVVSDLAGGEPDPVVGHPHRPTPLRVARFKARALKLSEQRLVPAVLALLRASRG